LTSLSFIAKKSTIGQNECSGQPIVLFEELSACA
jgi:hypothetical protein